MQVSSPSNAPQLPIKKRKIVTSCTECYRRKQKCDRKTPCSNCVARDVTTKCIYMKSPVQAPKKTKLFIDDENKKKNSPLEDQLFDLPADEGELTEDLSQLGYSSVAGTNAFMELEQLFKDGPEFRSVHTTHNRPPPPSQLGTAALSIIARLPPRPVLDELITLFFSDVNWHYSIVEKFYFYDLLSRWVDTKLGLVAYLSSDDLSQELRYFPAVIFQVVALALQFLPPDAEVARNFSSGEKGLSKRYSDMGLELMRLLDGQGMALTAVQASLLRASWLKNLGRGMEAWHILGDAIRQSQELGLHRQQGARCSSSNTVEETLSLFWYNEHKRRLWINLYTWDSPMALILGRPKIISNDDCDTQTPIDCSIPDDPSKTVPMTVSTSEEQPPSSMSAPLIRYSISTKIHEIRALKLDRPHPKDYSMVKTLHNQVLSILDNATPVLRQEDPDTSFDLKYPYLSQQREELVTIVHTFLTALHRPHITTREESRDAAFRAAISVLDSQQRLFNQASKQQHRLCLLSFYSVDAGILLSSFTALYPPQSREDKRDLNRVLQQCIDRLSVMAPCNPTAKSGLDIIQRCYGKLQQSHQVSSPTVDVAPALKSITGALSQDTSGGLDMGPAPFELDSFVENKRLELLTSDDSDNYFDQSYWLQQIDHIFPTNDPLENMSMWEMPQVEDRSSNYIS